MATSISESYPGAGAIGGFVEALVNPQTFAVSAQYIDDHIIAPYAQVTWPLVAGAVSYQVFVGLAPDTLAPASDILPADSTVFFLKNPVKKTTYYVRVSAHKTNEQSDFSNMASVYIGPTRIVMDPALIVR